jgi:hypothetical protein
MSHLRISRAIAALVIVSALGVPAASAQPIDPPSVPPAIQTQTQSVAAPVESVTADTSGPGQGFDWDDAAVGAGAALIVLSAGVAGVVTIRRGRARSHALLGS